MGRVRPRPTVGITASTRFKSFPNHPAGERLRQFQVQVIVCVEGQHSALRFRFSNHGNCGIGKTQARVSSVPRRRLLPPGTGLSRVQARVPALPIEVGQPERRSRDYALPVKPSRSQETRTPEEGLTPCAGEEITHESTAGFMLAVPFIVKCDQKAGVEDNHTRCP
jgi:hypothetical protein